jgi:uncharacterized membrane protein YdjX (TVP38/TMEM64 family)
MSERAGSGARGWFAVAAAALLLVLFLVSMGSHSWIAQDATYLVNRVANEGWYGQGVFLSVLTVACLTGIVPASVLAMAAGTIYGFGRGTLLSAIGLSIGGIVGFLAARFLFQEMARPWVNSRISLRRIDADIARQGWKIVILLRLSPVAPFGITSYAFGLTRLRFVDYLFGTVGSLPAMVAYVYMGVLAREALNATSGAMIPWVRLGVMGLGVVATAIAAIHFYRLLTRVAANEGIGADL